MKVSLRSLKCLITSDVSEEICFMRNALLNTTLSFNDFGCAES